MAWFTVFPNERFKIVTDRNGRREVLEVAVIEHRRKCKNYIDSGPIKEKYDRWQTIAEDPTRSHTVRKHAAERAEKYRMKLRSR